MAFLLQVLLSSFCKQETCDTCKLHTVFDFDTHNSVFREDYFLGFFFVLDCVSTASLLLDLTWVRQALLPAAVLRNEILQRLPTR